MTARRYLVVRGGMESDYEPVHPGTISYEEAQKLRAAIAEAGHHAEVWSDEQWERYDAQVREECFDEGD